MAILTGTEILRQMELRTITISPLPVKVNSNSVNLTLHDEMLVYNVHHSPYCDYSWGVWSEQNPAGFVTYLDPRRKNPTIQLKIPVGGYVLKPGVVYLAATVEFTETFGYVPVLEGRSSVGRLGLAIHICAGYGETGFCGRWTCELEAIHPVLVLPGQQICQLSFNTVEGEITNYDGKYLGQNGPVASRFWQELSDK